jgi:hypothetical protein
LRIGRINYADHEEREKTVAKNIVDELLVEAVAALKLCLETNELPLRAEQAAQAVVDKFKKR